MRLGIFGFVLGVIVSLFAVFTFQRFMVAPVAGQLSYRFYNYVFDETEFPKGDLENGRTIRRSLLPIKITTRFYDAQFNEVKQADKPGRYGAVVEIDTAGTKVYRFATLYRIPTKIFWQETPMPISAQLLPEIGLNPIVLRNQQREIGDMIKNSFIDDDNNVSASMAILFAGLSDTPPDAPPAVARTNAIARNADWWFELRGRLGLGEKYPYLVDLPQGYYADSGRHWPLVLFLADADDRGDDIRHVRRSGLAGLIAGGKQLPAVVVSPQCPLNEDWNVRVLSRLIDEVSAKYHVDSDRVYLTGISAGGDASWALAMAYPERFAAVVPICGEGDFADAARLKNVPIWAFHGLNDEVVPVNETTNMVEAIRAAGGHPHMTLFPHAGHGSWDQAYTNEALYKWMFAQKRGQPEVMTPGVPTTGGVSRNVL